MQKTSQLQRLKKNLWFLKRPYWYIHKQRLNLLRSLRVFYLRSCGFKTVNVFWCKCGKDGKNFGDLIGPELLQSMGYYPVFTAASESKLEIISAGSILGAIPQSYRGIILGSGFIRRETEKTFPYAKVLAVKGLLTLEKLKRNTDVVLGDPGLILCDIIQRQTKEIEIGIVPHYIDQDDPRLLLLRKRFEDKILFIDVQRPAVDVIRDVDRCKMVLSSSLHGCIVSDGFGIPNAHIKFNELDGGDFNFDDYYSVYGIPNKSIELTGNETYASLKNMPHSSPNGVAQIQSQLRQIFNDLPSHLSN